MSGTPRVSVVMSVRNAERFVARAVESILAQTLRDLEFVVVDHASSDRTPAILSTLARQDARLRVHRAGGDSALASALNVACERSRAPLIARMDGDDVSVSDRLERQATYLDSDPSVALVGGAAIVIDAAGRAHHLLRPPTHDADIRACLLERNCIIHPTVMMRRAALREVGGYRPRFAVAQDYDLWLRLADRHRLANLPDVVLHYRRHPRQVSVQALEQQVLSSLAAQAAARRRRAGTEDGGNAIEDTANGTNRIAREDLAGLGVTDDAIRNALARACLHRAADLSDINEAELAVQTLAMTPGYRTSEDVRRHILARYHSFLARRRWQRGQVGGSLISALRAVRMRPSLLGRVARVPVRWSHDAPNFRMAGQETGPPPRLVESAEPDPGPDPGRAPRA